MTPHIEAKLEDIAPNVIMPGDPNRAKYIAEKFLTDAKLVNTVRGELAFTGYYNGVKVTIFSSGMGIPSMGIYSYELFKYYNVQNIIRIGSAGSYTEDLNVKDILLVNECYSKSSYKIEGENKEVLPSNSILNEKIMLTSKTLGLNITLGNTYCAESFYELDLNVKDLIDKYKVQIIAIGNGTASRESEKFVARVIQEAGLNVEYIIVSEAGASVYSASKLAIEEFPDLTVEKRSAISIGRRLQDPLAELVKITPESIGVGQYQHDVANKKLTESLDFVVSKAVNSVGVNINTASPSLLKYVSGITKKNIDKIIDYRDKTGRINSREEIMKKKLLGDKTYEQAIGFLRILDGDNVLDATAVHPESYSIVMSLLEELGMSIQDIGTEKLINKLEEIDIDKYKDILNTDIYTLKDIIDSLKKPNRDPRDDMPKPLLKSDVLDIKDLQVGMKLQGTVRNVIDFGAFVDIGLHNDGLIHISKMSNSYIKHPSEILNVGDIIDCYVIDINKEKEKVSLSLIDPTLLKN